MPQNSTNYSQISDRSRISSGYSASSYNMGMSQYATTNQRSRMSDYPSSIWSSRIIDYSNLQGNHSNKSGLISDLYGRRQYSQYADSQNTFYYSDMTSQYQGSMVMLEDGHRRNMCLNSQHQNPGILQRLVSWFGCMTPEMEQPQSRRSYRHFVAEEDERWRPDYIQYMTHRRN